MISAQKEREDKLEFRLNRRRDIKNSGNKTHNRRGEKMAVIAQWQSVRLWYERIRVRDSLIAQIKKLEDVEIEKTRTLERISKNPKKRKGGESPRKRERNHRENLDQIDSSMGQI